MDKDVNNLLRELVQHLERREGRSCYVPTGPACSISSHSNSSSHSSSNPPTYTVASARVKMKTAKVAVRGRIWSVSVMVRRLRKVYIKTVHDT